MCADALLQKPMGGPEQPSTSNCATCKETLVGRSQAHSKPTPTCAKESNAPITALVAAVGTSIMNTCYN